MPRPASRRLETGAGLAAIGIRPNKVAILAEGSNAWIVSKLGMFYAGAVSVPLSVKLEESNDLLFRMRHAEVKALSCRNTNCRKSAASAPDCRSWSRSSSSDTFRWNPGETALRNAPRLEPRHLSKNREFLAASDRGIRNDDYATITYTRARRRTPKGRRADAPQLRPTSSSRCRASTFRRRSDAHHTAAGPLLRPRRGVLHHDRMRRHGGDGAGRRDADGDAQEHSAEYPRSAPALPAVGAGAGQEFPQEHRGFDPRQGPLHRGAFQPRAPRHTHTTATGTARGSGWRVLLAPSSGCSTRVLFRKGAAGVRWPPLRFFVRRGALLDAELQQFFYAIGIPMFQGYGLSEATPVISTNSPKHHWHRFGSSGKILIPLDLKILDEAGREVPRGEKGEIVIRGENVMAGYWKNPGATAETVRDGWLHTGDMGYVSEDDFLYVLGRFKSLLIASGRRKIQPRRNGKRRSWTKSPLHRPDHRAQWPSPFTGAIVVPNREAAPPSWRPAGSRAKSGRETSAEILGGEIDRYRAGGVFGGGSRTLAAGRTGHCGRTVHGQNGLVNSTMKVVRGRSRSISATGSITFTRPGRSLKNAKKPRIAEKNRGVKRKFSAAENLDK